MTKSAQKSLSMGNKYPYDETRESIDWAHRAARGVIADLTDRRGIKNGFQDISNEIRMEIVDSMSEIIRTAYAMNETL